MSEKKVDEGTKDNEIRITKEGILSKYIGYAFRLIQDEKKSLIIKAMGKTINKGITVAEIIKRRIPGLHQITELGTVQVVDVYEPLEEGLDRVELTRLIASVTIELSFRQLDTNHFGYQPPISPELFAQLSAERLARGPRRTNRQFESSRRTASRTEAQKDKQSDREKKERPPFRDRDTRGRGGGNRGRGWGRGRRGGQRRGSRRNSTGNNRQPHNHLQVKSQTD